MVKGLVYNKKTNQVVYKFDTGIIPDVKPDEAVVLREDIDMIEGGAVYNSDNSYINPPLPPPQRDWKAEYAALTTDAARVAKIAEKLGLR